MPQAYPAPAASIQALLDFETLLEAIFVPIAEVDAFIEAEGVQVNDSRQVDIAATPRVDVHAVLGQNMDYLSFAIQGKQPRQTPNAYFFDLIFKVSTTRANDSATNLHGQIRGRLRFLMAAPANLLSAQATYPYIQVLEVLPGQTVPGVMESKDQDTSAMSFRGKFAINDWAWPIIISEPPNISVTHPAAAVFSFGYLAGTGALTFQWQVSTNGGATWANTTDGGSYSGSATDTLTVSPTSTPENGYQFRCNITNTYSQTIRTTAATLTVA